MEKNKITVFCENNGQEYQIPTGSSLKEFKKIVFPMNHQNILGALVNNEVQDLHYEIYNPKYVNFIDVTTLDGYSVYLRSLIFVLYKAIRDLYPKKTLIVEYNLSNGLFCRLANKEFILSGERIEEIKIEMLRIIDHDYEITRTETPTEEAIKLFNRQGLKDKELLLSTRGKMFTSVYSIDGTCDYFYGTLAPSTGCLKVFDLKDYKDGMLLMLPDRDNPTQILPFVPQEKLFSTFSEFKRWGKISEVIQIGHLNHAIEHKHAGDMIKVSEALHEKKMANIADDIAKRKNVKMVLIAGPSSSGKTTFAKRLGVELRLNGLKPVTISVDNYFVERVDNPKDENGDYDFECLEAIDLELFNNHIKTLLDGGTIDVPTFDFKVGTKRYNGEKMHLADDEILVIEGIHCLNDKLTSSIPMEQKYKIYISDLTVLNIDYCNRISTTDTRLIRRIVRDNNFRGYSALHSLRPWASVNRGENKNIFPYQENCDVMFNSSLIYELSVLKKQALPLLQEITNAEPEYAEAKRLAEFLKYFEEVDEGLIPQNSLLREFVGGSIFGD